VIHECVGGGAIVIGGGGVAAEGTSGGMVIIAADKEWSASAVPLVDYTLTTDDRIGNVRLNTILVFVVFVVV